MFNVKTTAFVATALLGLASASGAMAGGNTTPNASSTVPTVMGSSAFAATEIAFTVDLTISVDDVMMALASAIGVNVNTIIFVSDSNPPS